MTPQELQKMVEEIVVQVMQRIENDAVLRQYFHLEQAGDDAVDFTATNSATTNKNIPIESQKKLYTERDILELARRGRKMLTVSKKTIITPSAIDAARAKGVTITRE